MNENSRAEAGPIERPVGRLEPERDAVGDAWRCGSAIQYLVLTGYDEEWTDYAVDCAPDTGSRRLAWRLKPPNA